ncbi:hypothetical protein GJ496_001828 [Pomphorhynchus laevis]|nr:hypothetical protein GJ496_001828 [Pomphorhynchus laevis]
MEFNFRHKRENLLKFVKSDFNKVQCDTETMDIYTEPDGFQYMKLDKNQAILAIKDVNSITLEEVVTLKNRLKKLDHCLNVLTLALVSTENSICYLSFDDITDKIQYCKNNLSKNTVL